MVTAGDTDPAFDPESVVEPPLTYARGHEGSCEVCGRLVVLDEAVRVYGDGVVVHEVCPVPRARA